MTAREIEAAIISLQTYDGCTEVMCKDVTGENCQCGRMVRKAFAAAAQARIRDETKP